VHVNVSLDDWVDGLIFTVLYVVMRVPVAVWSKTRVSGRFLVGIAGSNPAGGMNVCLLWVLYVVR
jgi:hypothetical protein